MVRGQSISLDSLEDPGPKYQRALVQFQSDAKALKRGMVTALFVQRFKHGLSKPV